VRPTSDSSTTGGLQSAGRAATPHKLRPSGDAQPGFDAAKKQVLGGGASPKVDAAKVSGTLSGQLAETPLGVVAGHSARMRPSSALGQEFSPQSASLSGAPSRPFKPIQMDEGQMADACYVSGLKSFQVNLVLGALNQHLERNGGAFNREQFKAEVGETSVSDKLKAADFVLENVVNTPIAEDVSQTVSKSVPEARDSSSHSALPVAGESVMSPETRARIHQAQMDLARAKIEDTSPGELGLKRPEYTIIDPTGGGVCHTYALGLADAPKSPEEVRDAANAQSRSQVAVCFKNGQVAHTAFFDPDPKYPDKPWKQTAPGSPSPIFRTTTAALKRAYSAVEVHRSGKAISQPAWDAALRMK